MGPLQGPHTQSRASQTSMPTPPHVPLTCTHKQYMMPSHACTLCLTHVCMHSSHVYHVHDRVATIHSLYISHVIHICTYVLYTHNSHSHITYSTRVHTRGLLGAHGL